MRLFGKSTGFKENQSLGEKAVSGAKLIWLVVSFPIRALWRACTAAAKLTSTWWKDRKLVHLLRGIPSLLLAGVCVYFLIGMKAGFSRGQQYRSAGMAACAAEQWETAKLYLERAAELGIADNDTLFNLARAAEATDDSPKMVAILETLAPADHPVHVPAHFWKATQILTSGPVDRDRQDLARSHLKHVLTLDPEHTGANAVLGDMYFQQKLWNAAIQHLERTPRQNCKYRLLLAKACLEVGDKTRAASFARQAQQEAQLRSVASPENINDRLLWGDATMLLEEFEPAVRILKEGLALEENELLKIGLTRVYIFWADSIEGNSETDSKRKFALLAEGMKYNPNDVFLFDRLMKVLHNRSGASEDAKAFLLRNIVEGHAVGISHLMLGTAAWIEGDEENARIYLERAFALLPEATTVANNFAWYLASKDPPEPEKALKIIEPVLAIAPENHYVRDTRGHIYLKLNRWKEAVDDLEYAVQELRTNSETHQGLALAYRQLGLADLAAVHEKAAKILAERTSP